MAPLLCLAACASDDHPDRREGGLRAEGRESRGPGAGPSLFVSPAGEPFRAGPGEPYPVAAWFRAADADGDGKLTREEFVADAARFFQKLDANHDGVIDGLELKAYETDVLPELTEERAPQPARAQASSPTFGDESGRRRGGRRGVESGNVGGFGGLTQADGAAPYGLLGEREPVADADLDLDGRITLANFKSKAAQRFATLDVDGKGYLLLPELPKTLAQQGGRRGRGGGRRRPPGGQ